MTDEERRARIAELEGLIAKAKDDYYNKQPAVADDVYDAWLDELSELDAINRVVISIGAAPVSEWKKVKHESPMGSLDKVNALEEMTDWVNSYARGEALFVTEKLDGISLHVRYLNGKLTQAATRGDGYTGEDITLNVLKMKGIKEKLPKRLSFSLRGEIVLLKSDHQAWFKDDYANTRNAASGIAKRYDGRGCEHLTVMFYQVTDGVSFTTEEDQFRFIQELGLLTPGWALSGMWVGIKTPHDIWVDYQHMKRDRLDYDIDGLVVRINNLTKQLSLGDKDLRPKGAVAFKFAPVTRETVLRQVLRQTGGTGRITPVAVFDPVNLMGATVTNASLYNWKYIRDLKIDVGARVLVARANDVIPRVVALVRGVDTINQPPETCDVCGVRVVQDGEYHVCPNWGTCPAQVVGRLAQWISTLNILEWGDVLLEKLVTSGLVKSVPDLYLLTEEQIAGLDRMGPKVAAKVLENLNEKKDLPLETVLGALSIPGVATSTIKMAMDAGYDTFAALKSATLEQLIKVNGIGPVKADSLFKWLQTHGRIVEDLELAGVAIQEKIRGKLTGMSFCFTGSMSRKRPELEALVTSNGGEVKASVSKKLTYLVASAASTTKAAAAQKNGTKILTEDEFLGLVEG
jgi:DNA ligase (NAD+)